VQRPTPRLKLGREGPDSYAPSCTRRGEEIREGVGDGEEGQENKRGRRRRRKRRRRRRRDRSSSSSSSSV